MVYTTDDVVDVIDIDVFMILYTFSINPKPAFDGQTGILVVRRLACTIDLTIGFGATLRL